MRWPWGRPSPPPSPSDNGEILTGFIEARLAEEEARADQLNAAADRLLTTSAAFVALIVAIAALVLGKDFAITGSDGFAAAARVASVLAIVCFSVAAFFATRVQTLRKVKTASRSSLEEMVKKPVWTYTESRARSLKAFHLVEQTISMRDANDERAQKLKAASNWQAAAAAFVVMAVLCGFAAATPVAAPQQQIVCLGGPCPSPSPTISR